MLFLSKPTKTEKDGKTTKYLIKKNCYKYKSNLLSFSGIFYSNLFDQNHKYCQKMKLSAIVLLGSLIASTSAIQNYQTADMQLNITSPLINGVYAAGQILPLGYTPLNSSKYFILCVYVYQKVLMVNTFF
jgi:hypothetical protein